LAHSAPPELLAAMLQGWAPRKGKKGGREMKEGKKGEE